MGAEREVGRCILCDDRMIAKRSLTREEPTLLCSACRQRPESARAQLREAAVARRLEHEDESAMGILRPAAAPAVGGVTIREREHERRNGLRAHAVAAREHARVARAECSRQLARAHALMRRLDDLALAAQNLVRASDLARDGTRDTSAGRRRSHVPAESETRPAARGVALVGRSWL